MNASSPWVSNVQKLFKQSDLPVLYERALKKINFKCYAVGNIIPLVTTDKKKVPDGKIHVSQVDARFGQGIWSIF